MTKNKIITRQTRLEMQSQRQTTNEAAAETEAEVEPEADADADAVAEVEVDSLAVPVPALSLSLCVCSPFCVQVATAAADSCARHRGGTQTTWSIMRPSAVLDYLRSQALL